MTSVTFLFQNEVLQGFDIKGHSTYSENDEQGKLVCSAVSSAAYMTANTITEIIGAKADIKVNDGEMFLKVLSDFEDCLPILSGFLLHMKQLSKEYNKYVTINSEV